MRRAAAAAVGALALFLAASSALADGVVLPSRAIVKPVRTPDQRALVAFDGTTETMVVETTLQGEGSEFAWIVPLPAVPKVAASTTGLFPTLELVTAPQVVDKGKHGSDPGWRAPACLAVALLVVYVCSRQIGWIVSSIIGVLAFMGSMCLAAIGSITLAVDTGSVWLPHELARERVGAFDVATIDPGDGSGLHRWLDDNGFASPAAVDEVAADYARRGWVFVAAKLRVDEDAAAVRRLHPLAFTFPASEPVYPMRLTLAANPSCALELFAFGAGTADADGLSLAYSGAWHEPGRGEAGPHSEIARFALDRPVTKLTGALDAANCPGDLTLRWGPLREFRPELYTGRAAAERANKAGAWTALVAGFLVSIAVGSWRRGPPRVGLAVRVAAYVAVALAASLVCYETWSAAPRLPEDARQTFDHLDGGLKMAFSSGMKQMPAEVRADVASARAWMTSWINAMYLSWSIEHAPFEEDSPGNYTIRERDGRLELVTYDIAGREFVSESRDTR